MKIICVRQTRRCLYCGEDINIGYEAVKKRFINNDSGKTHWAHLHPECEPETREDFYPYKNPRPSKEIGQ